MLYKLSNKTKACITNNNNNCYYYYYYYNKNNNNNNHNHNNDNNNINSNNNNNKIASNLLGKVHVKVSIYYLYNIKNVDPNNIQIDEKSYKNILIY